VLDPPGSNTAIRPHSDEGVGIEYESCASQVADNKQERVYEGRDRHLGVTEIKAATKYVLIPSLSPYINLFCFTAVQLMPTPMATPKNPVFQVACRI
jgi:hypothetical protein